MFRLIYTHKEFLNGCLVYSEDWVNDLKINFFFSIHLNFNKNFLKKGAIAGITATFLTPRFMDKYGIRKSGMSFMIFQNGMLILALLTFVLPKKPHAYLFLFAVVVSRIGLWGFDLVEVQLMQISIESHERGSINSVESSMTSLATLTSFLLGIINSKPSNFFWLVLVSYICVTIAVALYSVWCYKFRDNILYGPKPKFIPIENDTSTEHLLVDDNEDDPLERNINNNNFNVLMDDSQPITNQLEFGIHNSGKGKEKDN